ncbi:DUF4367 domain-containing protein [Desulfuribacillus alkaliarsenatis]|uniref:DUF4367 domain-containing protein n=1 Tax=Desulfuribacillus alkaliarsenatis TaxID=766136 RepID=A0A1E5FZX3_9FIRM|nr:DUF4367 domain-containing protein [Desulfuribacillus alkaliarsenatis]OEF96126.1 hypothetical protein BHF68_10365 [Desulfuribacillus alkaliarsenatis]
MNYKKYNEEEILEDVVHEQLKNIEAPDRDKELLWNQIQEKLHHSNNKPRNSSMIKLIAGIAASLLIFFVFAIQSNNSGTAFFWYIQKFFVSNDSTTQITLETENESSDNGPPSNADSNIVYYSIEYHNYTLEQAQEMIDFNIIIPRYIPENYKFEYAFPGFRSSPYEISLYYENKDTIDSITIQQIYLGADNDATEIGFNGVEIENTFIYGHQITIFASNEDRLILLLELPDIKIIILGSIDRNEMLRIAESML